MSLAVNTGIDFLRGKNCQTVGSIIWTRPDLSVTANMSCDFLVPQTLFPFKIFIWLILSDAFIQLATSREISLQLSANKILGRFFLSTGNILSTLRCIFLIL